MATPREREPARGLNVAVTILVVLLLGLNFAVTFLEPEWTRSIRTANRVVMTLGYAVAFGYSLRCALFSGFSRLTRLAWSLSAIACLVTGMVSLFFLAMLVPALRAPGLITYTGWLSNLGYLFFVAQFTVMALKQDPPRWLRFITEAFVVALTFGTIYYAFFVAPVRLERPQVVVTLDSMAFTPILAMICLFIIARLVKDPGLPRIGLVMQTLLVAAILRVIGQTLHVLSITQEWPLMPIVGAFGSAVGLVVALAAYNQWRTKEDLAPSERTRTSTIADTVWPYVLSILVLVIAQTLSPGFLLVDRQILEFGSAAVIGVAFVRQAQVIHENGILRHQMELLGSTLEDRVETRNGQISGLLDFGKFVHSSLSEIEIMERAQRHARSLFQADECQVVVQRLEDRPDSPDVWRYGVLPPEGGGAVLEEAIGPSNQFGGMITLRRAEPFEDNDATLLRLFGLELLSAMENARLYSTALRAAYYDQLTGLLNHRGVFGTLSRALDRGEPFSLLVVDVDRFRTINEIGGHVKGDGLLREVGRCLRECLKQEDAVGRTGGDEFIVVLTGYDRAAALDLAIRIRSSVGELPPIEGIPITVSIGVASYPEDGGNRTELLTATDAMLTDARLSGRGVASLDAEQQENLAWVATSSVLNAFIEAIDGHDGRTLAHSKEVTEGALLIGERLGLSEASLRSLRIAGLLHDLGKLAVPEEILTKREPLNPEDQAQMNRHPVTGAAIAESIGMPGEIVLALRHHHERWDGGGFPLGLQRDLIPLFSRIIAVAEAYASLRERGRSDREARIELDHGTGTQFDPDCVRAFLHSPTALPPQKAIVSLASGGGFQIDEESLDSTTPA